MTDEEILDRYANVVERIAKRRNLTTDAVMTVLTLAMSDVADAYKHELQTLRLAQLSGQFEQLDALHNYLVEHHPDRLSASGRIVECTTALITDLDNLICQQNELVRRHDRTIQERTATVTELECAIDRGNGEISTLRVSLREQDDEIQRLRKEIERLQARWEQSFTPTTAQTEPSVPVVGATLPAAAHIVQSGAAPSSTNGKASRTTASNASTNASSGTRYEMSTAEMKQVVIQAMHKMAKDGQAPNTTMLVSAGIPVGALLKRLGVSYSTLAHEAGLQTTGRGRGRSGREVAVSGDTFRG